MTGPQRDRLAAAQSALLRALLADGPAPPGFDPARLALETAALRAKRRRVVAKLEPRACRALGEKFPAVFDEYAREHPKRTDTRAGEDARAFVAWARTRGHLRRRLPWR
ncbi:hypothetical protein ORV05_17380 [Amycolatopsis cynarae]|uniref:SCO6045-like C-terminal domain-containing protein n=1 Tax=Amycolatopsis cynarae TaxID=2995223 RepID=A0ABY7BAR8_9PSEU|nr:hypothetical protein [Amycolatopsis sp. HUAS 11-8]WAL69465.1 hypothetical protein ORV05_17380 [Amycolatopsis sp. HUAS 11-8]